MQEFFYLKKRPSFSLWETNSFGSAQFNCVLNHIWRTKIFFSFFFNVLKNFILKGDLATRLFLIQSFDKFLRCSVVAVVHTGNNLLFYRHKRTSKNVDKHFNSIPRSSFDWGHLHVDVAIGRSWSRIRKIGWGKALLDEVAKRCVPILNGHCWSGARSASPTVSA